jgi:L-asparagine transporter-like permease
MKLKAKTLKILSIVFLALAVIGIVYMVATKQGSTFALLPIFLALAAVFLSAAAKKKKDQELKEI